MYLYLSYLYLSFLSYPILSYPIHPSIYLSVSVEEYVHNPPLLFSHPQFSEEKHCHAWPPWRFRPRWNLAIGTGGPLGPLLPIQRVSPGWAKKTCEDLPREGSKSGIAHTSSAGKYQNQDSQCEKGKVRESWKSHPPIIVTPVAGGMVAQSTCCDIDDHYHHYYCS